MEFNGNVDTITKKRNAGAFISGLCFLLGVAFAKGGIDTSEPQWRQEVVDAHVERYISAQAEQVDNSQLSEAFKAAKNGENTITIKREPVTIAKNEIKAVIDSGKKEAESTPLFFFTLAAATLVAGACGAFSAYQLHEEKRKLEAPAPSAHG